MLALPESGQGTNSKEVNLGDALEEIIDWWAGET